MARFRIPFNRPAYFGREFTYIRDAIRRGQLSGDGHYTGLCSKKLEAMTSAARVLLTPSATHALELAAILLDVRPGDDVIVPSFTFTSTVNAFVLRGAVPRFVDVRPDTLCLDERQVEAAVTKRTKVIVPVHYAGVPCDMGALLRIAKKRGLAMVEDAAQALGASWHGRPAGGFGALNAFSFHETKNVGCGEGGALAITDPKHVERAEIIRQKGTNRAQFYRGEVDKYSWVDVGSSFVPSELQSAYLFAQLEKIGAVQRRRRALYERYARSLAPLAAKGHFGLPYVPPKVASSYHLFHLLFPSERERNRVMDGLRARGIMSVFHYFPLHLSKMGRQFGYRSGDFPVSERAGACLLRLPLYTQMTFAEQTTVLRELKRLF